MAAINFEKLSLKELIALEAKLAAAIATARQKERAEIKSKVAELAERHGFSVSELFGGLGRGNGRKKSVSIAKYANPDDKTDTWTGRGRKPNWLLARLKKGAKLSDFEI
jgi:DNA-binding protein H-NS